MKLFKPITDMWKQVQSLTESAGSLLEGVSGGGLDGMMRQFMGITPDGLIRKVDSDMGAGVMRLVSEDDKEGLKIAVEWRDYVVSGLEEMREAALILHKFSSGDAVEAEESVREMSEYLKERGPEIARRRKERTMEAELRRLRKMVKEMSEFLETDIPVDESKKAMRPQPLSGSGSNSGQGVRNEVVKESEHKD